MNHNNLRRRQVTPESEAPIAVWNRDVMKLVSSAKRRFRGKLNRGRRETSRSKQRRAVTERRRSDGADGAVEIDGGGSSAKS